MYAISCTIPGTNVGLQRKATVFSNLVETQYIQPASFINTAAISKHYNRLVAIKTKPWVRSRTNTLFQSTDEACTISKHAHVP